MPLPFPLLPASLLIFGYIFIEIAAFIFIGSKIGILPCLLLVLLSSLAGWRLLQNTLQGFSAQIKTAIRRDKPADKAVMRRFIRAIAAILLIIPGFVSSLGGLILLLPPIQARLSSFIGKNSKASFIFRAQPGAGEGAASSARQKGPIIDLEPENYHARDPENSPWRQP